MTATYKDLFEDEVAAILRSLPFTGSVRIGFYSFYPAGMICEDGMGAVPPFSTSRAVT